MSTQTDPAEVDRTVASRPGNHDHRGERGGAHAAGPGDLVAVRRNILLSGLVGGLAGLIGLAFLSRSSWVLDRPLGALLVLVAAGHLVALASWRVPVLVADSQGIRLRLGMTWRGLPWASIRQVVVEHSDSPLRDGRLVVVPRDLSITSGSLDALALLHVRWNKQWYAAPLAVPLGLTTLVDAADLAGELRTLSGGTVDIADLRGPHLSQLEEPLVRPQALQPPPAEDDAVALLPGTTLPGGMERVLPAPLPQDDGYSPLADDVFDHTAEPEAVEPEAVEPEPETDLLEEGEATEAIDLAELRAAFDADDAVEVEIEEADTEFAEAEVVAGEVVELPPPPEDDLVLPPPVSPLREVRRGVRADILFHRPRRPKHEPAEAGDRIENDVFPDQRGIEDRAPQDGEREEREPELGHRGPEEIAALLAGAPVPLIDDLAAPVEATPVIGAKIAHAREMLDMSIEELSRRTAIRPHVLEAMELDDFTPCGGDVYARGHLTSVARILGLTLEPLLAVYDERYAQGPINARRVFEAELSTGVSGGMRAALHGPRWSLLISAVLCLTMVWSLARVFAGDGEHLNAAPPADDVAVQAANRQPITSPLMQTTPMTVTASHAPAHVIVRDRIGKILWSGDLKLGQHRKVVGLAPFKVSADNGGAVEVSVNKKALGAVGTAGEQSTKTFG